MKNRNNEIFHYASEYYDPVKAHEYYEEHKKLKGRKRASLNEEGQKVADYVKQQLKNERDSRIATSKSSMDSGIENAKNTKSLTLENQKRQMESEIEAENNRRDAEIEQHTKQTQAKIDQLSAKLAKMSPKYKAKYGARIKSQIDGIRATNSEKRNEVKTAAKNSIAQMREKNKIERDKLNQEFKATSATLRGKHKEEKESANKDYETKLANELDKISSESQYIKPKKGKKGKTGKTGAKWDGGYW